MCASGNNESVIIKIVSVEVEQLFDRNIREYLSIMPGDYPRETYRTLFSMVMKRIRYKSDSTGLQSQLHLLLTDKVYDSTSSRFSSLIWRLSIITKHPHQATVKPIGGSTWKAWLFLLEGVFSLQEFTILGNSLPHHWGSSSESLSCQ